MQQQIKNLIDILSTPTYFANEEKLVEKICNILKENDVSYEVDDVGNIYVTKGEAEFYPCVVAHTDTVHELESINIRETLDHGMLCLSAYNDSGMPTGIGGDDKCGVFVCLEVIKSLNNIKAVFLVGEEFGCYGARMANPIFFDNVGYAIQFDAPYHNWVSHVSYGVKLFDENGEFYNHIQPILEKYMGKYTLGNHPYTDVCVLKNKYDFSCINISVGYHNMHTREEFVDVNTTLRTVEIAKDMINTLGTKKYEFISKTRDVLFEHIDSIQQLKYKFLSRKTKSD